MRKHRRLLQIIILSAVVLVAAYTLWGNVQDGNSQAEAKVGHQAIDFNLQGLDGQMHSLADYKGKPMVVNFWGSFCEPCVREMPLIQKYYEQYQDQGVAFIGINLDEPTVTVQSFVNEVKVTFPILLDRNIVSKQYGVVSYPTTFFIRPDGQIAYKFIGEMQDQDVKMRLEALRSAN